MRLAIAIGVVLGSGCKTAARPHVPAELVSPAPKAGGCAEAWLSREMTDVMDIDVHGDHLYWVEAGRGRIQRVPLAGGPPEVLVEGEDGANVAEIVVWEDLVVWLRGDGTLWSVPITGGAVTDVGQGLGAPHTLVLHDDHLYLSSSNGLFRMSTTEVTRLAEEAASFAVDGTDVYVEAAAPAPCAGDCRAIVRVPIDGSAPATVVLTGSDVASVLVHGDRVLFGWDSVRAADKRGGGAIETLATDVFLVRNLQTAGDRIYFTADNVVYQLRDGAAPVALAQRNPITDLVIDGDTVYTSVLNVGIRRQCHDAGGPPIELVPRPAAPVCAPGQTPRRDGFLDACLDAQGAMVAFRYWYHSGHLAEKAALGGASESFYTDGTKHQEARTGADVKQPGEGPTRIWYADGTLAQEGAYDAAGQKHGPWTVHAPDGSVRARETWAHGERVEP